jgi:hypothetical protein
MLREVERYSESLKENIPRDSIEQLWAAVDATLRHGPLGEDAARTGLALGYVQSGKTANIIGLLAAAADRGYRVVIALLGSTNLLVDQNAQRVRDALILNRRDYVWRELSGLKGATGGAELRNWLDRGRVIFIPVIKHAGRLRDLTTALERAALDSMPVLIVDDEADQASLNTSSKPEKESATYGALAGLRRAVPEHLYVQYTATPYAPLLLDLGDQLSPEFVTLLHPGRGYTGGREFFVDFSSTVIRPIPSSDEQAAKALPTRLPNSLVQATANFLLGAACLLAAGEENAPVSMLVHSTQRNDVQARYHFLLQRLLRSWERPIAEARTMPDLPADFKQELDHLVDAGATRPPDSELFGVLRRVLRETTCWLVNSESAVRSVDWDAAPVHLLVGGNKLDRGFTVEGLTVTYMNRPPSNQIDTLEQRARAFGYRRDFLPYCQFFATPRTLKVLRDIVFTEYDLRAELTDVLESGGTVHDWATDVGLLLPAGTKPTRPNVIAALNRFNATAESWHALRQPSLDPRDIVQNNALVADLALAEAPRTIYGRLAFSTQTIATTDLIERLLEPWAVASYSAGWRHADVLDHLRRVAPVIHEIPVIYMDDQEGGPRLRKWDELGFVNLFQGRDLGRPKSGWYPGDRAVPDADPSGVALQIHYVAPRNSPGTPVHTLALRLGDIQRVRKAEQ